MCLGLLLVGGAVRAQRLRRRRRRRRRPRDGVAERLAVALPVLGGHERHKARVDLAVCGAIHSDGAGVVLPLDAALVANGGAHAAVVGNPIPKIVHQPARIVTRVQSVVACHRVVHRAHVHKVLTAVDHGGLGGEGDVNIKRTVAAGARQLDCHAQLKGAAVLAGFGRTLHRILERRRNRDGAIDALARVLEPKVGVVQRGERMFLGGTVARELRTRRLGIHHRGGGNLAKPLDGARLLASSAVVPLVLDVGDGVGAPHARRVVLGGDSGPPRVPRKTVPAGHVGLERGLNVLAGGVVERRVDGAPHERASPRGAVVGAGAGRRAARRHEVVGRARMLAVEVALVVVLHAIRAAHGLGVRVVAAQVGAHGGVGRLELRLAPLVLTGLRPPLAAHEFARRVGVQAAVARVEPSHVVGIALPAVGVARGRGVGAAGDGGRCRLRNRKGGLAGLGGVAARVLHLELEVVLVAARLLEVVFGIGAVRQPIAVRGRVRTSLLTSAEGEGAGEQLGRVVRQVVRGACVRVPVHPQHQLVAGATVAGAGHEHPNLVGDVVVKLLIVDLGAGAVDRLGRCEIAKLRGLGVLDPHPGVASVALVRADVLRGEAPHLLDGATRVGGIGVAQDLLGPGEVGLALLDGLKVAVRRQPPLHDGGGLVPFVAGGAVVLVRVHAALEVQVLARARHNLGCKRVLHHVRGAAPGRLELGVAVRAPVVEGTGGRTRPRDLVRHALAPPDGGGLALDLAGPPHGQQRVHVDRASGHHRHVLNGGGLVGLHALGADGAVRRGAHVARIRHSRARKGAHHHGAEALTHVQRR